MYPIVSFFSKAHRIIQQVNLLASIPLGRLDNGGNYLMDFDAEQFNEFLVLLINSINFMFIYRDFIFGFLLLLLLYLVYSFTRLQSSNHETTPIYLSLPIAITEIAFPFWLLIKGVNRELYQERVTSAN